MPTEKIRSASFNPSTVDLGDSTELVVDYFAAEGGTLTLTPSGLVEPESFQLDAQPEGAAPFKATVTAKERGNYSIVFELHGYKRIAPLKVR